MRYGKHTATIALSLALLLAGCGDGGGSSSSTGRHPPPKEESPTINGIVVPPAPDPTANAATIGGVDSDNNSIRDDIDRWLATTYGDDATTYAALVPIAKSLHAMLVEPTPQNADIHIAELLCATDERLRQADAVTQSTIDTKERENLYATILAGHAIDESGCSQ